MILLLHRVFSYLIPFTDTNGSIECKLRSVVNQPRQRTLAEQTAIAFPLHAESYANPISNALGPVLRSYKSKITRVNRSFYTC